MKDKGELPSISVTYRCIKCGKQITTNVYVHFDQERICYGYIPMFGKVLPLCIDCIVEIQKNAGRIQDLCKPDHYTEFARSDTESSAYYDIAEMEATIY